MTKYQLQAPKSVALSQLGESQALFGLEMQQLLAAPDGKTNRLSCCPDKVSLTFRQKGAQWFSPFDMMNEQISHAVAAEQESWEWPIELECRADLLLPEPEILQKLKELPIHWLCASQQFAFQTPDLNLIQTLQDLQGLELDWSGLKDKQHPDFSPFEQLRHLDLSWTGIGSWSIASMTELHNLRSLHLWAVPITQQDSQNIAKLEDLECLNLSGSFVNNEAFRALESLRSLQALWLWDTEIDDDGLFVLTHMDNLRSLELMRTKIEGWSFAKLTNKTQLQSINLRETPVGNVALGFLEALPNLKKLDLRQTRITRDDIKRFVHNRREWGLPAIQILY